jgi:hypothetical protein
MVSPALAGQPVDQRERRPDGEVFVVLGVVHLDRRGGAATGQALHLFEREPPVGGLLAVADAEALGDRLADAQRAA